MASLREIIASFTVEFDKEGELDKGGHNVDSLLHHVLDFGKTVAAVFGAHELFHFAEGLIEQAVELKHSAVALGTVPQELQKIEFAAGTAGVGVDQLRGALAKFNKAAAGEGEKSGPFTKLGVDLKNQDGTVKTSTALFEEVGEKLHEIKDPIERAGLASKFFGRAYANILPLFAEGKDGIEKLKKEAEELGIVFDDTFIEQSHEVEVATKKIKAGLNGLAIQALAPLLPYLVSITESVVEFVKETSHWVRSSHLIKAVLLALSAKGLVRLIKLVPQVVKFFGGWRKVLMAFGRVLFRVILPLLALEDILTFFAGGKSVTGGLIEKLFGKGTVGKVREFFSLFKDAPDQVRALFADLPKDLARSLGAFGTFLGGWGQSIVDVALFAVDLVTGGWENAGNKIEAVWDGVKLAAEILWTEVKFLGLEAAAALSDAWDNFLNDFRDKAGTIAKIAMLIPGGQAIGAAVQLASGVAGDKTAAPHAAADVKEMRDDARLALADKGDKIGARLTAPNPELAAKQAFKAVPNLQPGFGVLADVSQSNNIVNNVTVEGGDGKEVVDAISKGTKKGLNTKELHAALVHGAG